MRPAILDRLFAPVTALPGIGRSSRKLIERAAGPAVVDLLWHLPTGLIDRRAAPAIGQLNPRDWKDEIVTVKARVEAHEPGIGRRPYRVVCSDDTGTLVLVYFNVKGDQLARLLPVGAERDRQRQGRVLRRHAADRASRPGRAVRRATTGSDGDRAGLSADRRPVVARSGKGRCRGAASARPSLPEWLDPALRERRRWPGWREALAAAHAPQSAADLDPETPARERLAYDEILSSQLAVALVRARRRRRKGRVLAGTGELQARAEAGFGFALTGSQRQALAEIAGDMKSPHRMMRLLQGDVGSGKTVVALLAMLIAVESGAQAALMAPTEVLARQHHATLHAARRAGRGRDRAADRAREGAGARFDAGEPRLGADP